MSTFLFTSESVSEGHPDKVADQISDAILDAILAQEPRSRVAAETLVKDNLVVLAGEITTNARVDYARVARETIKRIGYTDPEIGFDAHGSTVLVQYGEQSQHIAQGVNEGQGLDRIDNKYLDQFEEFRVFRAKSTPTNGGSNGSRVAPTETATPVEQIETAGICTVENNHEFFSHRAEKGRTGRLGAVICL